MTVATKILLCMGTRPEIVKMAPAHYALQEAGLQPFVVHTGQHEELAWPFYHFFEMAPSLHVDLQRQRPTLGHLTSLVLEALDPLVEREAPAAILVQGDTTSALAAAIIGFYHQIPVGHIEAGLRSHVFYNPFPEEKNRELIGRLTRWHFAPTAKAVENLRAEGIADNAIHQVGNTVVDATLWGMAKLERHFANTVTGAPQFAAKLPLNGAARLVLVTAHRRENWHGPLVSIARAVRDIAESHPDVIVLWPVHGNPEVADTVHAQMQSLAPDAARRVLLLAPLEYPDLLWILKKAWAVLSDSGGLQEEAPSARVPVLVLRDTTERPEIIEAGGGVLVGTDRTTICDWFDRLSNDPALHERMCNVTNPFGDGRAGERIASLLRAEFPAAGDTRTARAHEA